MDCRRSRSSVPSARSSPGIPADCRPCGQGGLQSAGSGAAPGQELRGLSSPAGRSGGWGSARQRAALLAMVAEETDQQADRKAQVTEVVAGRHLLDRLWYMVCSGSAACRNSGMTAGSDILHHRRILASAQCPASRQNSCPAGYIVGTSTSPGA